MADLFTPELPELAENQRAIHRRATTLSRSVRNRTPEPITAVKSIALACRGRAGCRCRGSTAWSLLARLFCPRQCQWHTLRRNGATHLWCLRGRCFAKRHDVSTFVGASRGTQSCLQFS